MRPVALLVTGSRALVHTPEAWVWSRAVLRDVIEALPPGDLPRSCVLHGGADGPDTWAGEIAAARGLTVVEYRLDGRRYVNGRDSGERWTDLVPPDHADRTLPLQRNATMVVVCAAIRGEWDVRVLGLRCQWAPTHGTEHTLRLARAAGLPVVDERTCPRELGPGARS